MCRDKAVEKSEGIRHSIDIEGVDVFVHLSTMEGEGFRSISPLPSVPDGRQQGKWPCRVARRHQPSHSFHHSGPRLQDGDVVDGLAIAVVHLERLPVRREAGRETQFVHFKPQPQE